MNGNGGSRYAVRWLLGPLLCAGPVVAGESAGEEGMFAITGPELLLSAPDDATAVFSTCTYSRSEDEELILGYSYQRMSDVADESYYRWSEDNGKTWSHAVKVGDKLDPSAAKGTVLPSGPYVSGFRNPFTRERVVISTPRVKPGDMDADVPETYWTQTAMTYATSTDDGRTLGELRPLIKRGPEFSEQHPFEGLYLGKNQVYGVHKALFLDADTVLVPLEVSVLGEDGAVYNPHGWDFSQVIVLIGKRTEDGFGWDSAEPIVVDAFRESTRGMNEPTLAELADGTITMVMRGSNSFIADLPTHKWISRSEDRGRSWSHPQPWTYDDGALFFSPSSICHLVRHSGGRLFWFGNICPANADGNGPRYPLVVGEVDTDTGLLRKATVTTIADRSPEQSPAIQFSNFSVYEDRVTHELVLDVTHFYPGGKPNRRNTGEAYTGNAYRYRIGPG